MNNGNYNGYYPGNGYPGGYPYNGQPNGNGQGNGNGYPQGFVNGGGNNAAQARTIQWTGPALQQVQQMVGNPRFGGDPQGWHEEKVTEYVAANVPQANRVRIRYVHKTTTNSCLVLNHAFDNIGSPCTSADRTPRKGSILRSAA